MLRPFPPSSQTWEVPSDPEGGIPSQRAAFETADHPAGIRFYRPRDTFFFPYHAMQWMSWEDQRISLSFPENEVVIEGQALHRLYVALAQQRVAVVVQQAIPPGEGVFVQRIQRVPRNRPGGGEEPNNHEG